jgi:hypothetical protein
LLTNQLDEKHERGPFVKTETTKEERITNSQQAANIKSGREVVTFYFHEKHNAFGFYLILTKWKKEHFKPSCS